MQIPPSENSPRCPNCKRPFQPGREKCMWCGCALGGVPIPEAHLICPACGEGTDLEERREDDMIVHLCRKCGGVWLGRHMLDKLEKHYENVTNHDGATDHDERKRAAQTALRQGIVDKGLDAGYRRCPLCGVLMSRRRYRKISNVIIDECVGHGVWFDADELDSVIQFLDSGGLGEAREYEASERSQFKSASVIDLQNARVLSRMLGGRYRF